MKTKEQNIRPEPQPREKYLHFKGGRYEVVCVSRDPSYPKRKIVVYRQLYEGDYPLGTEWHRSLEEFLGDKDKGDYKVKRFEGPLED